MARLHIEDAQALMNIRTKLINDYERLLDGAMAPAMAVVKQSDVSKTLSFAILSLEQVLEQGGDIKFEKAKK